MNSKFSGILSQARNRASQEDDELAVSELPKTETVLSPTKPPQMAPPQAAISRSAPAARKGPSSADGNAANGNTPEPSHAVEPLSSRESSPPAALRGPASPDAMPEAARGRPRGKRSDPNFTQITAYISKQTHQNIKMALLREGKNREISQLIEERLVAWLAERNASDQ